MKEMEEERKKEKEMFDKEREGFVSPGKGYYRYCMLCFTG